MPGRVSTGCGPGSSRGSLLGWWMASECEHSTPVSIDEPFDIFPNRGRIFATATRTGEFPTDTDFTVKQPAEATFSTAEG